MQARFLVVVNNGFIVPFYSCFQNLQDNGEDKSRKQVSHSFCNLLKNRESQTERDTRFWGGNEGFIDDKDSPSL